MQCKGCKTFFKLDTPRQKFCTKECCHKHYVPISNKRNLERNKIVYKSQFKKKEGTRKFCLMCDKPFMSLGKWNRLCDACKRDPAFSWDNDGYSCVKGRKR